MIHEIIQLIGNYQTEQWHAPARAKGEKEGTLFLTYLCHKFAILIGPVKVPDYVSIKTTTPVQGNRSKTFTFCENCKLCSRTGIAISMRTRTYIERINIYIRCKFSLLSCNCFVVSCCSGSRCRVSYYI